MITLVPLHQIEPGEVDALLDAAFGLDRLGRTAYRIREGAQPVSALSLAALEYGALIGTLQSWPIALHLDAGGSVPMVMVGPVAVRPERQQGGIGRQLMSQMLAAADAATNFGAEPAPLSLIGDPAYYGRFFGFTAERTGQWRVPGPVEQKRLLARGAGVPAEAGMLGPRVPAIA